MKCLVRDIRTYKEDAEFVWLAKLLGHSVMLGVKC